MSIQKVNTRSTFKLSEVKVAGKTQPEKRKRIPIVGDAGERFLREHSRVGCGYRLLRRGVQQLSRRDLRHQRLRLRGVGVPA